VNPFQPPLPKRVNTLIIVNLIVVLAWSAKSLFSKLKPFVGAIHELFLLNSWRCPIEKFLAHVCGLFLWLTFFENDPSPRSPKKLYNDKKSKHSVVRENLWLFHSNKP
jgi:hypothetical protein